MLATLAQGELRDIRQKVEDGTRLSRDEGLALYETDDLFALGEMAEIVNKRKSGNLVRFIINRQINPTNICVLDCKFCEFAAKKDDPHAYEMTLDEVLARCSDDLTEVHIVGGLHADWPFEHYVRIIQTIHEKFPKIQIKAWTAVEIDFFSRLAKISLEEVLRRLKEAGLGLLPGGGAEVFSERVRQELFRHKIGQNRWLQVHETAHRMGIPSNSTLLYGHVETRQERIDHMITLRQAQDKTQGFQSFIPLAFQPGNTGIVDRQASAIEDLKTVAISRLMLDNIPHIKAYWVMLGEETASVALNFGADDLDGTIGEEKIAHMALATSPESLTRDRLIQMIREAGKVPAERDAFYNIKSIPSP